MGIFSMILLAVVLVANIVMFTLFFIEKRRNNQRYKAMLDYIACTVEDSASAYKDETAKLWDAKAEQQKTEVLQKLQEAITQQEAKTTARLNGMLLDYTQAQEAAGKINTFAGSLSAIFDYDPIQALQKSRNREAN